MRLYLGYDGSFVLSKSRLVKRWDKHGGNFFLSPVRGQCCDVEEYCSAGVFAAFGLKQWDVVVLDIKVTRPKTAREARTRPENARKKPKTARKPQKTGA